MRRVLVIILLFIFQHFFSQSILNGKVVSDVANLEGIHVLNATTRENVFTDAQGYFSINAKPNDVLVIASLQIEGLEIMLNNNSFRQNPLIIKVKGKINLLDEIQISKITTKSLGIVSKDVKEYTPAERKLISAGVFKWYSPLLIPLGGMSVDGLINKLSGRTERLKKELIVERKEIQFDKFDTWFDEDFYVKTLKIPIEYIKGFKMYALEDKDLNNAVNDKNKTLVKFLLGELSVKYKTITFPEKN